MAMVHIPNIKLPSELELFSVERNLAGETNEVYFATGKYQGRSVEIYIKVSKNPRHYLDNERAVLEALTTSGVPVSKLLWYAEGERSVLMQEALPGRMIWDYIDPRRGLYERGNVSSYLRDYGRWLARIHNLPIVWAPQKRSKLCGLIGEETLDDPRFKTLVVWLQEHSPSHRQNVFVHGDLNTASVLVENRNVSGIIDWEFAGHGWREYDIAWVLRARMKFLNTLNERESILAGYREFSGYDENSLRWCEVLNYLHFAYWDLDSEPAYVDFAIKRANEMAGISP